MTIRYGIMDPLVALISEPNLSPRILNNAAWTLSNICRGRTPPPDIDTVSSIYVAAAGEGRGGEEGEAFNAQKSPLEVMYSCGKGRHMYMYSCVYKHFDSVSP